MKKITTLFLIFFSIIIAQSQTKVGDAVLSNALTFNKEKLIINGAGLREKIIFDIYAGALYLKKKSDNASMIANSDETMAVKVHVLSRLLTKKKLASALRNGFKKSTNDKTAPLNDRIEKFIGFVSEEIQVGQVFDLVYEKGKGSVLYKNGIEKGYVKGLDFKKALFNIWLGNNPVDKGLKDKMLGKK
ncbi:chalcone isomerase family protein [Aquimarina longa]|uniref:chalcone isomerase family protein n=1 Tax=Aquimarina longa TaxID=1080221 RepID=UPI00078252AF|nr:chalcone isomerase family protein [Aquimarina longa]